jgi:hypothetical protein
MGLFCFAVLVCSSYAVADPLPKFALKGIALHPDNLKYKPTADLIHFCFVDRSVARKIDLWALTPEVVRRDGDETRVVLARRYSLRTFAASGPQRSNVT